MPQGRCHRRDGVSGVVVFALAAMVGYPAALAGYNSALQKSMLECSGIGYDTCALLLEGLERTPIVPCPTFGTIKGVRVGSNRFGVV